MKLHWVLLCWGLGYSDIVGIMGIDEKEEDMCIRDIYRRERGNIGLIIDDCVLCYCVIVLL